MSREDREGPEGRCGAAYVICVSGRLETKRVELGLTQEAVAEACGWTHARYWAVENENGRVERATADRIAAAMSALGGAPVTTADLFRPAPKDCRRAAAR
jgi:transcriptional regulator with XRE-family HTH domain